LPDAQAQVDQVFAQIDEGTKPPGVTAKSVLDEDLERRDRLQDIGLKKSYANWLLWLLAVQVAITNGVFITYAWAGEGWDVPDAVMAGWLGATVVELIGVVTVVTRYLFPRRDQQ
jgi:hypothetical protein